jgi:hypothetical protein
VAAGAVLYANCSVAAGANTHIKGFADIYYKSEKSVAKGVIYYKDREDKQRHKEVIISLIKIKLRQLRRDIIIISLSLTSVFASLLFV